MCFISSLGEKLLATRILFTITSSKMKKGGGDKLSLVATTCKS